MHTRAHARTHTHTHTHILDGRLLLSCIRPITLTTSVQYEPTGCTIYFQFISVINLYMFRTGLMLIIRKYYSVRGGAGKPLARRGRIQATATKLGIYSTYSPRSSIYFLASCSNFCNPLKKFGRLSVQPGLRGNKDLRVGQKMATFQLFF